MGVPAEQKAASMREAVSFFQRARQRPYLLLAENESERREGVPDICILDMTNNKKDSAETWRKLHRDPNVEIVDEKYFSRPAGITAIIHFKRYPPAPKDVEAEVDDLWPEK